MVVVYLVMRSISLIQMLDPSKTNNTRPIYEEEVAKFGQLKLDEYDFNYGVVFRNKRDQPIRIPEDVGRVI